MQKIDRLQRVLAKKQAFQTKFPALRLAGEQMRPLQTLQAKGRTAEVGKTTPQLKLETSITFFIRTGGEEQVEQISVMQQSHQDSRAEFQGLSRELQRIFVISASVISAWVLSAWAFRILS